MAAQYLLLEVVAMLLELWVVLSALQAAMGTLVVTFFSRPDPGQFSLEGLCV
jgi:hypothetical protein